jgi:hypothetical protein
LDSQDFAGATPSLAIQMPRRREAVQAALTKVLSAIHPGQRIAKTVGR